jgi:CBASS immunity effector Cap15-like protein
MLSLIAQKMAEVLGVVFLHTATENLVTDRKALKTALSHSVVFRSRHLRVSMAQILSLRIDDRFLLIANVRRPERVSPIGGVVRYFHSEVSRLEGEIGFVPELTKTGEKYDLRGRLQGKNFVHFLKWFATGAGREQWALAREIEEEFNEIGIPEINDYVRYPEFVKERVVHEGPSEVNKRDIWQYRYFEVLSLREESQRSKLLAEFIREKSRGNSKLVAVTTDDIRKGRLSDGRIIGDSAGYLFSGAAEGIEAPPLM